MVQVIKPAHRAATETEPEMARTGRCRGHKCECLKVTDAFVNVDWETCGVCKHTTFMHDWEAVVT